MSRNNRSKNDTWTKGELESELKSFRESTSKNRKDRDTYEENQDRRKHRVEDAVHNQKEENREERRRERRDRDETEEEREERKRRRKEREEREKKNDEKEEEDKRRRRDKNENDEDREEQRRRKKDREEVEGQKDADEEERLRRRKHREEKGHHKGDEDERDEEREERRRRRKERAERERKKQTDAQAGNDGEGKRREEDNEEDQEERRRRREERKRREERVRTPELTHEESNTKNYDEDFDEDFEQGSDKSVEKPSVSDQHEKTRAHKDEEANQRTYRQARIPTESVTVYKTSINYNSESMDRQRRRANDLMKTLELDKKVFTLLDLNPEEMSTIYSAHLKHAKCQTNEEKDESETQTEDIDVENKWTQHPSEDVRQVSGGDKPNRVYEDILSLYKTDTDHLSLNRFLGKASNLILTLLNEKKDNHAQLDTTKNASSELTFAKEYFNLKIPKILSKARMTNCSFCENKQELFTTCFIAQTDYGENSIFVIWSINEPTNPQKFLYLEGVSTSCCFYSNLVISGNHEGSVSLWDTREPDSLHQFNSMKNSSNYVFRSPTYSTAGVLKTENHSSEVKCVKILQNEIKTTNDGALFMQLATLELDNNLIIWTVVELNESDSAGSNIDLGLLPGGKIKLVKSSSINLFGLVRTPLGRIPYQTLQFSTPKNDTNNFYVTTDLVGKTSKVLPNDITIKMYLLKGQIIHVSRDGGLCTPSSIRSELTEGILHVNYMAFHHELCDVCLVGYGNGELRLYHTQHRDPLNRWFFACETNSIEKIEWIKSKMSSAIVLDSKNTFYVWDFLIDDTKPILKSSLNNDKAISIAISNVIQIDEKQELINSNIAICDSKAHEVKIHKLKSDCIQPNKKEKKNFEKLIKNYIATF